MYLTSKLSLDHEDWEVAIALMHLAGILDHARIGRAAPYDGHSGAKSTVVVSSSSFSHDIYVSKIGKGEIIITYGDVVNPSVVNPKDISAAIAAAGSQSRQGLETKVNPTSG